MVVVVKILILHAIFKVLMTFEFRSGYH